MGDSLPDDKIPKELQAAEFLLISHVAQVMERIESGDDKLPDSFKGVLEYARKVGKFKQDSAVNEVLARLEEYNDLSPFQKASIVNLMPVDVVEAKALIPSLQEYDDERLQELIDALKAIKTFSH